MTENEIKSEAKKILEFESWVYWFPPKVRFYKQTDIFGVFDFVAAQDCVRIFVQITTKSNLSKRRKKIQEFLTKNKLRDFRAYVWAIDPKTGEFARHRIEPI